MVSYWRVIALLLLLLAVPGHAGERDVVFAERPERELKLNIHTPLGSAGPLPVLMYVFGGSYVVGDRQALSANSDILRLTRDGIAVITFDYRYSTEAVFPAQIHDVTAAICWVRRHAGDYGLDPTRIALLGHSAGGHLAALAALGADTPGLADSSCSSGESRVQAVVDFFGPTDFDLAMRTVTNPQVLRTIEQLFGAPLEQLPEPVALASVVNKVSSNGPPLLIVHGDADPIVPYSQSLSLLEAARASGQNVRMITVINGGHGSGGEAPLAFGSPALHALVREFLTQQLQP